MNVIDQPPLEWRPIQMGGVTNLDNTALNNEWCKNRNMCVVDLIQYRYSNRKGFIKKNKDEKTIEFWSTHRIDDMEPKVYEVDWEIQEKGLMNPNKTGYTIKHIKCWCENMNVNMYCVSEVGTLIDRYKNEKARIKKTPPLVFVIKNNHMYPILKSSKIKSITNNKKLISNFGRDPYIIAQESIDQKIHQKIQEYKKQDNKKKRWLFGPINEEEYVTVCDVKKLLSKQENKCYICCDVVIITGYTPECCYQMTLDRIDENLPHNKNNVLVCCIYCNCRDWKNSYIQLQGIKDNPQWNYKICPRGCHTMKRDDITRKRTDALVQKEANILKLK